MEMQEAPERTGGTAALPSVTEPQTAANLDPKPPLIFGKDDLDPAPLPGLGGVVSTDRPPRPGTIRVEDP